MTTVKNNRVRGRVKDFEGDNDFIQPRSVEDILDGKRPDLPGRRVA